jgi:hypothetical protein
MGRIAWDKFMRYTVAEWYTVIISNDQIGRPQHADDGVTRTVPDLIYFKNFFNLIPSSYMYIILVMIVTSRDNRLLWALEW